jgi:NitT/TauT family transport system ATP-binding protein
MRNGLDQALGPQKGMRPKIEFHNVSLSYESDIDRDEVTRSVSFTIEPGSTVALLGPSGCGKTSLLKSLLKEMEPTSGAIRIDEDSDYTFRRGAVFQDASIFPWMTALGNVQFTLRLAGWSSTDGEEIAWDWLRQVGLERYAGYFPSQLSGGMRQRVALARALAVDPDILGLDEPFGQLDQITRTSLNELFAKLALIGAPTTLLVTHSIEEAIYLGHRVVVLSERPARVLANVPVHLPWPRQPDVRYSREFTDLEREIAHYLHQSFSQGPDEPDTPTRTPRVAND